MRRLFALFAALLILASFAPAATAQDATPEASPVAADCVSPEIPPGTPTPMEASPAADMEGMDDAATPEDDGPPPPEASPEIPVGEPAPDDVVAEVEAALQNYANCLNAGDYVANAALYTEAGLLEECGTTNVYDGPTCFEGIPPITSVEATDVQVHDDGRISADITVQAGTFLLRFQDFFVVDENGVYLTDQSFDLPVPVPDSATVIEGEMVDYAFELSATSAPAGDIAFTVTNNGEYPHEIVVLQLPEGITIDDVFEDESLFGQVQFFGFTYADPGAEAPPLVLVDMQPGVYTLICFIDEPEGIPHVARGMIVEFEVTAP